MLPVLSREVVEGKQRVATILLDKTTKFIHRHRRLNNKILVPVNLADRAKPVGLKTKLPPSNSKG
jgi:hypothetical protein